MAPREAKCPRCGAPVSFPWAQAMAVVCAHCRATVVRGDVDVATIGQLALPAEDYSPLQVGASGKWRGTPFTVAGRLQLEIPDRAHWNEWFITLGDGRQGWLADAQGQYFVTEERALTGAPAWSDLRAGVRYTIAGETYAVLEVGEARCTGGEGTLPFAVGESYLYRFADLRTPSRRFATLDYGDDAHKPRYYAGEVVELRELGMEGLRQFDGW